MEREHKTAIENRTGEAERVLGYPAGMLAGLPFYGEVIRRRIGELPAERQGKTLGEVIPEKDRADFLADLAEAAENFRRRDLEDVREFGEGIDPQALRYQWGSPEINEQVVSLIERTDPVTEGDLVFYGPSNICFWYSLEEDMKPWKAHNHGIGGCIDPEMIAYAPRLLYPWKPAAVFFQTGSNDIASGIPLEAILANKRKMYALFLENMPESKLIICSGLPLPGRTQFWDATVRTNGLLRDMCGETDRLYFMDATDVMLTFAGPEELRTSDGRYFNPDLYRIDRIHLNKKGHDIWTGKMKEMLLKLGI